MKKKFLFLVSMLSIILMSTATYVFAADNMMNSIENGAKNVAEGVGNIVEKGVDATKNVANGVAKGAQDLTAGITKNNNTGNSNYGTTRTSTRTTAAMQDSEFAGMSAWGWSWIIIGVLGIAIVALVWYYGMQQSKEQKEDINMNQ